MTGLLTFAFVAGTVATANPCGFALLPAFIARQLGTESGAARAPDAVARALLAGALTTVGFLLVFGSVGAGIALGGRWLIQAMPWAALAIGIALVVAGLAVLTGRHIGVRLPLPARATAGGGHLSVLVFGVGYGVASLSCTLPIFLAVVGTAVTGNPLIGALTFVAYAAGMGTILTALAVATALSRAGLAAAIRRLLPHVTRLSGVLLIGAGAFVVYYWTFFLLPGTGTRESKPISVVTDLSSRLQTWLGGATGQTVSAVLIAMLALLALWALRRWALRRWGRSAGQAPARAARPLTGAGAPDTRPAPAVDRLVPGHGEERGA